MCKFHIRAVDNRGGLSGLVRAWEVSAGRLEGGKSVCGCTHVG